MSYDSVTNLRVPLTFEPGTYTVERMGQYVTAMRDPSSANGDDPDGRMDEMLTLRDWHFGDEHASISVMTDDENCIMQVGLRVDLTAPMTAGTSDSAFSSIASVELIHQSLTIGAAVDATWTTTLRTSDGIWIAHAQSGVSPARSLRVSDELTVGLDEADTLVSLTVYGTEIQAEPKQLNIDPENLRVSANEVNGILHVSIHAEFEHQMLDWHEDPEALAQIASHQSHVDAWLTGDADEPNLPVIEPQPSCATPERPFASPDGVLSLYDNNGTIASIELQASRGVVDVPDESPTSGSSESVRVDLRAGVTCVWQPGESADTYDISVTCGDRVADRWFGTADLRCGIAGDELAAIVMTDVRSFDEHQEMVGDMWAEDPVAHMEHLADAARFAAIDPNPAFAAIELRDWDGSVYGGPNPEDGDPGRVMVSYGDVRDQAGPQLEITMQSDLSPFPVFDELGMHMDAMTLARYLMSERMRDVESDDEAQQQFAHMNELAADIATHEWQLTTVEIDGEQVPARVIEVDEAWLAKLKYQGTQVTITAWKIPREAAVFTRLDSFAPFIEGSRQFMTQNLELSRQAFAEHPEGFPSNNGPSAEIVSIAGRFFDAMSSDALAVCDMLVDGIVERHGGRSTYIRLLRVYQAVAFNGGGGYNNDVRMSDDGLHASMPVHFDLPSDGEPSRGGSMTLSTGSEPRPRYEEPSDDDVQLNGHQLNVTLRFVQVADEWRVSTDILGALIDVWGPPAEAVVPR